VSDRNLVGSVQKAAQLLRAFSQADAELGMMELSRRLQLSKSSTHRLLTTLTTERFLERNPETGKYRLGLALYELGTRVSEHVDLHAAALPVLTTLRHNTGELVHVAVLDGLEVVYVERLESHNLLPIFRGVGHRLPAHCTSSGKVLLAAVPRDQLLHRLEGVTLEPRTAHTITSVDDLMADLERCRRRGWGSNIEEGHEGVSSVGAPIRGMDGAVIAAVSVVGASERINPATVSQFAKLVVEAGAVISRRLGYRTRRR
jgi:DNA-binding IclR family transcriptional regulator